jgi:hypothetical protein
MAKRLLVGCCGFGRGRSGFGLFNNAALLDDARRFTAMLGEAP